MTQDEIIEMARQAGMAYEEKLEVYVANIDDLQDFAKLTATRTLMNIDPSKFISWQEAFEAGAAKEREACEKACQEERNDHDDQFKSYEDTHLDGWIDGCNSCISAIRARGEA